jgi:hypothetical protein
MSGWVDYELDDFLRGRQHLFLYRAIELPPDLHSGEHSSNGMDRPLTYLVPGNLRHGAIHWWIGRIESRAASQ